MKSIKSPTLLIDKTKAIGNIRTMKLKAERNGVVFRPHFKTHQLAQVGELFRDEGIDKITVSSVSMANYFADQGWKDITIAFPLNLRELDDVIKLNQRVCLNILISSKIQIDELEKMNLNKPIGFFIEIDTGYHRSGLEIEEIDIIRNISYPASKNLIFKGLLSHFGNTYHAKSKNEILSIFDSGIEYLNQIKNRLDTQKEVVISVGDTPGCSLSKDFVDVDEIRPGNFVYFDLMQKQLGACDEEQIAAIVACPVTDIYPKRNEVLLYGGAIHFSKDYIITKNGIKTYGEVVLIKNGKWTKSLKNNYLKNLSQEHGIISANQELLSNIKSGDLLGIIPVHSCLSANLLKNEFHII